MTNQNIQKAVEFLQKNKIIIFPTDTLYGILANALSKETVEKVYEIKQRTPTKPYLILVKDIKTLQNFDVKLSKLEEKLLQIEGITVVLELKNPEKWDYLHRGTKSLAFRIPKKQPIKTLLEQVNLPLIAPSANPEGKQPSQTITQAKNYFKNKIDFYYDFGEIKNTKPSTIVKVKDRNIIIIREGIISKKDITDYFSENFNFMID